MRRFRLPHGWTRYLAPVGIGIFTVSLVIWMLFQQDATMDRLAANYDTLHAEYQSLYSEAVTGGVEPEAPAPDEVPAKAIDAPSLPIIDPEPAPSGPPGPGPTQAQVVSALATYCSVNNCRPTPTVAQVAAAISTYCANGDCQGEKGEAGKDADPVTADQVASAVALYCETGACRGADGKDGQPGRGPTPEEVFAQVKVYCDANNFCRGPSGTDGADSTVPGPKGDKGDPGTAKSGDYICPENEYMTGFSITTEGSVQYACAEVNSVVIPEPSPTPSG